MSFTNLNIDPPVDIFLAFKQSNAQNHNNDNYHFLPESDNTQNDAEEQRLHPEDVLNEPRRPINDQLQQRSIPRPTFGNRSSQANTFLTGQNNDELNYTVQNAIDLTSQQCQPGFVSKMTYPSKGIKRKIEENGYFGVPNSNSLYQAHFRGTKRRRNVPPAFSDMVHLKQNFHDLTEIQAQERMNFHIDAQNRLLPEWHAREYDFRDTTEALSEQMWHNNHLVPRKEQKFVQKIEAMITKPENDSFFNNLQTKFRPLRKDVNGVIQGVKGSAAEHLFMSTAPTHFNNIKHLGYSPNIRYLVDLYKKDLVDPKKDNLSLDDCRVNQKILQHSMILNATLFHWEKTFFTYFRNLRKVIQNDIRQLALLQEEQDKIFRAIFSLKEIIVASQRMCYDPKKPQNENVTTRAKFLFNHLREFYKILSFKESEKTGSNIEFDTCTQERINGMTPAQRTEKQLWVAKNKSRGITIKNGSDEIVTKALKIQDTEISE